MKQKHKKILQKLIAHLIMTVIIIIVALIILGLVAEMKSPEYNDYWTEQEMECYNKCGYQGLQLNRAVFCSWDDSCVTCVCESRDWEINKERYLNGNR